MACAPQRTAVSAMRRATLLTSMLSVAVAAAPLVLDGTAAAHTWDGFGGLSAGASSRLLRDYAEPSRSQILDALYLPSYGAGLKICKIEVRAAAAPACRVFSPIHARPLPPRLAAT